MTTKPREFTGLWETYEIITRERNEALAKIARLEEQGSRMSASQCVEPKNLCVEEGRAEVFCCAVEKIARLESALKWCKRQRNDYITDVISWPTGTVSDRKNEIKKVDAELDAILEGK